MNIRRYIFPWLLVVAISSCEKRDDVVHPEGAERLVGRWEWVRSYNPWTNSYSDPASSGRNIRIEYFPDGRFMRMWGDEFADGTYVIEVNDHLYQPFKLEHDAIMADHASWLYSFIRFDGRDTLHMMDHCRDCPSPHTFVRVK